MMKIEALPVLRRSVKDETAFWVSGSLFSFNTRLYFPDRRTTPLPRCIPLHILYFFVGLTPIQMVTWIFWSMCMYVPDIFDDLNTFIQHLFDIYFTIAIINVLCWCILYWLVYFDNMSYVWFLWYAKQQVNWEMGDTLCHRYVTM